MSEFGMPAGSVNVYRCDTCGGVTVTVHRDDGVTPMFLACRAEGAGDGLHCSGRATSLGYPIAPEIFGEPGWEWYRPTERELASHPLDVPETRDHVARGGLLLRRLAGVS